MIPVSCLRRGSQIGLALCFCSVAAGAFAQTPNGVPLPSDARAQAAALIRVQLTDTSAIQRTVALGLLHRASEDVRREAVPLIARALRDTSATVRVRALHALERLGPNARQLIDVVIELARNPAEPVREYALDVIAGLGPSDAGLRALSDAAADTVEDVRLAAADALRRVGQDSQATAVYRRSLSSTGAENRLWAARALAALGDSAALEVLRPMLSDSSFRRRTQAALALGALGPKARVAAPELINMLQDTVLRRIPQGSAWQLESAAPYAAWALSMILPFRSVSSNAVIDPVHVRVVGATNHLRDDGLGVYAWGVDSVAAFRGSGFFLMLSGYADLRGPIGPVSDAFRRSLSFDLSAPVPGSGARPLSVISDNEAYVWIWYMRDPDTDQVRTFRELPVSDSVHSIERVEMHFRINGVLHELQMGPFVEGQAGASQWYTGVHGDGTTLAQFVHPATNLWIIRAPEGSVARLWSFENRARPVDRGLYYFPLELHFRGMPGGGNGSCVPNPSSCYRSIDMSRR